MRQVQYDFFKRMEATKAQVCDRKKWGWSKGAIEADCRSKYSAQLNKLYGGKIWHDAIIAYGEVPRDLVTVVNELTKERQKAAKALLESGVEQRPHKVGADRAKGPGGNPAGPNTDRVRHAKELRSKAKYLSKQVAREEANRQASDAGIGKKKMSDAEFEQLVKSKKARVRVIVTVAVTIPQPVTGQVLLLRMCWGLSIFRMDVSGAHIYGALADAQG